MTDDEIRVVIAEAHFPKSTIAAAMGSFGKKVILPEFIDLPDYLHDLNAIHQAVMAQTPAFRKAMRFHLYELTDQMSAHDAPAPIRAEAFIRALFEIDRTQ